MRSPIMSNLHRPRPASFVLPPGFHLVGQAEVQQDSRFVASATHTHTDGLPCTCATECEEYLDREYYQQRESKDPRLAFLNWEYR